MDNRNDNNKTRVFSTDELRAKTGMNEGRSHSASDPRERSNRRPPLNPPKRVSELPRREKAQAPASPPSKSNGEPRTAADSKARRAPQSVDTAKKHEAQSRDNASHDTATFKKVAPIQNSSNVNRGGSAHNAHINAENERTRQIDITRRPASGTPVRSAQSAVNPARRENSQASVKPAAHPANHPSHSGEHMPVSAQKPSAPSAHRNKTAPASHAQNDDYTFEDHGGEAVGGALNSVLKAVIYIVSVLVVSAFLSYFGITVCNDVFAFVKDSSETVIDIPEYATVGDIAKILKANKIISYPSIFKLYASLRHDSGEYIAGEYTVTPSMNYDDLLSAFKAPVVERQQVSITIPEGYTVDEIIELFVSKGMGTREGFVAAIEDFEWDYWFVLEADANRSPYRKYRLEGYLFPDTYYYFSDSNEVTIISKMLENFAVKFPQELRERCTQLDYTVDEIVTIASMIQMEAMYPSEFPYISAVFHNRLDNPSNETQGYLQSDPTIQYALGGHEILTAENLELDSPYNTYKYKGLPPSPICNPDLNAINYALYPEQIDYLYFVAEDSGYHLFASNYQDHINNRLLVGR